MILSVNLDNYIKSFLFLCKISEFAITKILIDFNLLLKCSFQKYFIIYLTHTQTLISIQNNNSLLNNLIFKKPAIKSNQLGLN